MTDCASTDVIVDYDIYSSIKGEWVHRRIDVSLVNGKQTPREFAEEWRNSPSIVALVERGELLDYRINGEPYGPS